MSRESFHPKKDNSKSYGRHKYRVKQLSRTDISTGEHYRRHYSKYKSDISEINKKLDKDSFEEARIRRRKSQNKSKKFKLSTISIGGILEAKGIKL